MPYLGQTLVLTSFSHSIPHVQEMLSDFNLPRINSEDELFKISLMREGRNAKRSELL